VSSLSNVTVLKLDVLSTESVAEAAKAVAESGKGLDVVVNNAGCGYAQPILDIDIAKAQRLFDTNLWGVIRMVQGFADLLITSKGKIINISTVGAIVNTPWIGKSQRRQAHHTRRSC
jgi:NAD(P)-dependent dehydrogenase (short-subunit alcohol dehydrogenase family)